MPPKKQTNNPGTFGHSPSESKAAGDRNNGDDSDTSARSVASVPANRNNGAAAAAASAEKDEELPETVGAPGAALDAPRRERPHADVIKLLSGTKEKPKVQVLRRIGPEIFVRYFIDKAERWKSLKMIEMTQLASRHPNIVMPLLAVKHRDGRIEIDTEFADAGNAMIYLVTFPLEYKVLAAKSVARQLVASLHYFDVVHDKQHRNICPTTVFFRRDGCVKLGFYDLMNPSVVKENPTWYLENPYVPPECRGRSELHIEQRCRTDSKADVWMVGVMILSIITGKTFLPKVPKKRYDDEEAPQPTEGQAAAFKNECEMFEQIVNGDAKAWRVLIPDAKLRYFTKRCLRRQVDFRASLAELAALVHVLGGVWDEKHNQKHDPDIEWPFDPRSLLGGNPTPEQAEQLLAAMQGLMGTNLSFAATKTTPAKAAETAPKKNLKPAEIIDPWMTDLEGLRKEYNVESAGLRKEYNVESAGPPIRRSVERKHWITDESGEIVITEKAAEQLRTVSILLHLELQSWRCARNDPGKRAPIDKAMRDVVKRRGRLAWLALQCGITVVREAAGKADEAKRADEAKKADAPTPTL